MKKYLVYSGWFVLSVMQFCWAGPSLIINGGFETGDLTGWQTIDCETPGTSYGVAEFDVNGAGSDSWAFWTQPDNGGDILAQDIFLYQGQTYNFSADILARNNSNVEHLGIKYAQAWIGDSMIASHYYSSTLIPSNALWRNTMESEFSVPITGSYTFKILWWRASTLGSSHITGWADDIQIESSQPIPAPAAVVLGLMGLGLVGRFRRRFA